MEQVENWNEDFMDGTFNGSAKGGRKKEEKGQRILILNQVRIENPAKSRWLFSPKCSIVDIWQEF